jgi:hypothetical protein
MPTNIEKLVAANIVDPAVPLTNAQEEAIASLTSEEVDALISAKQKTHEAFTTAAGPPTSISIQHHFQ